MKLPGSAIVIVEVGLKSAEAINCNLIACMQGELQDLRPWTIDC